MFTISFSTCHNYSHFLQKKKKKKSKFYIITVNMRNSLKININAVLKTFCKKIDYNCSYFLRVKVITVKF